MTRGLCWLPLMLVALGAVSGLLAVEQEVFLPPDCDVLKIVGNGFKLELTQFENIKKNFEQVAAESAQVDGPRDSSTHNDHENAGVEGVEAGEPGEGQAIEGADERPVSNEHLFEEAQRETADYGLVDDELLRWITDRATALLNRIQRYEDELAGAKTGERIVLNILLLNTLVDLDNLNKEAVVHLRWVKNKLQKLLTKDIHREAKLGEVREFVLYHIDRNIAIESAVRGGNEPGKDWVRNTQAIKRVLHEQRFSEELSKLIVEFLAGKFNMMKRSVVYEINRQPQQLDDGLYYARARGRVPASFPFPAQDAIAHGVYN